MEKKDKCLYGESQFDIELWKVLQLVHVWPIKLWDPFEHNYLKKHNGEQQTNWEILKKHKGKHKSLMERWHY
jgi:hypothetical protein